MTFMVDMTFIVHFMNSLCLTASIKKEGGGDGSAVNSELEILWSDHIGLKASL